jgi:hypothetical protein
MGSKMVEGDFPFDKPTTGKVGSGFGRPALRFVVGVLRDPGGVPGV